MLNAEVSADLLLPVFNASPGQKLPVVLDADPGRIVAARWGFPVPAPKRTGRIVINARAETVHQKPMFRDAFRERRCLVIADGFYEWQKRAGLKQPFRITIGDDEPFAFAGIWKEVDRQRVYVILTTGPNRVTRPIHDRMPVILERTEEAPWLDRRLDPERVRALLDPYPEDRMQAYPVSRAVNDSGNEGPALVEPVGPPLPGTG
jgi:putative SOS response-associated peptidase YedK